MVGKGLGARRGRVTRAVLLAVLAVLLALGAWTSVSAAEAFPGTQLTNNSYNDYSYGVSGDRTVWMGWDGADWEVYTWTLAGGTVRITDNAFHDESPKVSGDRVAWYAFDGSDYEIYTWTPTGGTVRITDNSYEDMVSRVSGDRIVWTRDTDSSNEIYTWTPTGGVVQLASNPYSAWAGGVSGDRVVWYAYDGVYDYEIYTWTPGTGVVQVTTNSVDDREPRVSGDRIVWTRDDSIYIDESELCTWTPAGGAVQLTNGEADVNPVVSGDRIAWERYDAASAYWDSEIYTWTSAGGVVRVTNNAYEDVYPEISGDRIAWSQQVWDYGPAGLSPATKSEKLLELGEARVAAQDSAPTLGPNSDLGLADYGDVLQSSVMTWTPTGGTVQAASYAAYPYVDGNRLVWDSFDPNYVQDTEVFTSVAHTRFDDKSAKITYAPGWSRWDNSNYWAAFSDTYAYTDKKGDKVMVTFDGTSAAVVACTSNTKGKAQVSLYSGAAEPANLVSTSTVDLYSSTTKWKQQVYSTGTMASGTYTLVVECLYEKRSASGWYTIDVDGFDILGTLEQSPTTTPVDDKDYAHFTYDPGVATGASTSQWSRWDNSNYWAAYLDTYAYTDQLGFKTSFTFNGTYASWLACTSNSKGKALVTVDGDTANAKTVDLYSPTTKWKQKVYDTGILSPGSHTIVIECLRTKNPASVWYTIDVDRFDVILSTP